jgi:hypothetical protein
MLCLLTHAKSHASNFNLQAEPAQPLNIPDSLVINEANNCKQQL